MSGEQLQDMAKFYLKELFYGIPEIPVSFGEPDEMEEDILGVFCLEKSPDYSLEEDELLNAPEYRWHYVRLWDELGGKDVGEDESWQDPLNHPDARILISTRCRKCARTLVATLLHELMHYYCWYAGYDHHDKDMDFHKRCIEMGLPTNYDREWNGRNWVYAYDYTKIDKYIRMYGNRTEHKTAGAA